VARGYHQVHLGRQAFEQIIQRRVDGRFSDEVKIVEDQYENRKSAIAWARRVVLP
jgi:hypothetical protein